MANTSYDKAKHTKYTKTQFERLLKSVNYLLPKIESQQAFRAEYGSYLWKAGQPPRIAKRRARELNNIRKALEVIKNTSFAQI